MNGKKFIVKADNFGRFALKEKIDRYTKPDSVKTQIILGVNAELRLVDPFILNNGTFIFSSQLAKSRALNIDNVLKKNRPNDNLYYSVDLLNYVCSIAFDKAENKVINKVIKLYIPIGVKQEKGEYTLVGKDVTSSFPIEVRNNFLNTLSRFLDLRLS